MVMPNWIYEPLPYLYAGVGVVSFLQLDTLLGRLSSILLISAGVVIWCTRHEARRKKR